MNEFKNVGQESKRVGRRRKWLFLLLFLVVFGGLIAWFLRQKSQEYNLSMNPKANMVLINEVLAESTLCDERWVSKVEKLSKKLDQEIEKIKSLEIDDSEYEKILSEFAILQAEVSHNLQELLKHVTSDQKIENQALVDNLSYTYSAYKNHYQTKVER